MAGKEPVPTITKANKGDFSKAAIGEMGCWVQQPNDATGNDEAVSYQARPVCDG